MYIKTYYLSIPNANIKSFEQGFFVQFFPKCFGHIARFFKKVALEEQCSSLKNHQIF